MMRRYLCNARSGLINSYPATVNPTNQTPCMLSTVYRIAVFLLV